VKNSAFCVHLRQLPPALRFSAFFLFQAGGVGVLDAVLI
jgi:hypothetical protein